ncbi:MAG: TerB family tellurite resistance protein [Pseudomonadales bacterium]|nr:TerB family tellurite resistance protein [Pseudomonadales bacterium]MDG1442768.1 TerB family tellurite resistance protein [Pseudomonadales bacterium]
MLNSIKKFFEEHLQPEISDGTTNAQGIEYATAALLIELAKSDFAEHPLERQLIVAMLRDTFELADEDLEQLLTLAESGTSDANDLFQFTSLVNDHYTNEQKIILLENFWKVAYADGRLDKYEELFIRKVAGLINLPPSEFTKTKHRIKQSLAP